MASISSGFPVGGPFPKLSPQSALGTSEVYSSESSEVQAYGSLLGGQNLCVHFCAWDLKLSVGDSLFWRGSGFGVFASGVRAWSMKAWSATRGLITRGSEPRPEI